MRIKLEDLPDEYRKQVETKLNSESSVCGGKPKQNRQIALEQKAKVPRLHTPVYIIVRCYKRGCTWDADNIETKAIIDSLVKIGALANDTVMEAPRITREGIVVKSEEEEKTVIEVCEL